MEITKKRAVIYCRVSTKEQVEEGNSLVTQEKLCREYAQKNDFEVVLTYIEQGESAKNTDRTELKKMLAFCTTKKNHINAVIAYKIDRISRNTDDYSQIRILLRQYGIEIKSTSEYFEDSPAGKFMENILANVAQFDNDVRSERCANGMKEAIKEGRYVWMAPFGYSNIKANGKSTIAPNNNAKYVLKAFQMAAEDIYPIESIRQHLVQNGMSRKEVPFKKAQFYAMLKNPLYTGWTFKFNQWYQGSYEPIISETLFQKVQSLLSTKNKKPKIFKVQNEDFPLRRFITHSSGKKLTGAWSKGRHKKYPYYFFHSLKLAYKKDVLEERFKELLNEFKLLPEQYEKFLFLLNHYNTVALEENKATVVRIKDKIAELKVKKKTIIDKNLQGIIDNLFCKELLDEVDLEIFGLERENKFLSESLNESVKCLNSVKEALLEPGKHWEEANLALKSHLQWFYFPHGIEIDTLESRTPKMSKIYKIKSEILNRFSANVHHPNSSSNHSCLISRTDPNTTLLRNDELAMSEILQEMKILAEILYGVEIKNFADSRLQMH